MGDMETQKRLCVWCYPTTYANGPVPKCLMKGICGVWLTTRHNCFAECFRHSAKPRKHSAKSLSSVTLDKEVSTNCTSATASLSSTFSVTQQRKVTVTATSDDDGDFAECPQWHSTKREPLPSACWPNTRQRRLQWTPTASSMLSAASWNSAKGAPVCLFASPFVECARMHSAKKASLSGAETTTLGKEALLVPRCAFFAKCFNHCTRQRSSRQRAWHSAKSRIPVVAGASGL